MSTIREVAKLAGVSITTVSRILNNDETFIVSKETRKKVMEAVKKLKYERKRRKGMNSQVKISIIKSFDERTEMEDPYFISLKIDLEREIRKKGMKSRTFSLDDIKNLNNDKENLADGNFIYLSTSDAILIIGEIEDSQRRILKNINKNIICVDAYSTDNIFDYIKFDTRNSVALILEYLTGLNHKKIGLLVGRNQFVKNLIDFREVHFKEIMESLGLFNSSFLEVGEFSPESGYLMMKKLLSYTEIPTAVFCGNDSIAMGAYRAIREKNLKIPSDISVIGFNDLKLSQYMTPPLTTVRIDTGIIAIEAVNSLTELLNGERNYSKKVYLPVELIERGSCQKI